MPDYLIKKSNLILISKVDDEIVIMNSLKGYYYGLDNIASQIWEFLGENGQTFNAICENLASQYEVDAEICQADTLEFLNTMKDEGLIEFGT